MERTKAKFVIATRSRPGKAPQELEEFLNQVRDLAAQRDVVVLGYTLTPGDCCWNHGVFLEGLPKAMAGLMGTLTMALMPARYSSISLEDPGVSEGAFHFSQ